MDARPTTPADDPETEVPDVEARAPSLSAGDAAAWPDEHGDALFRYARLRVGRRELAEDLVQETFLAALRSRDRFRGGATVRTWLISILRHKIVDWYRRAAEPGAMGGANPNQNQNHEHEHHADADTNSGSGRRPDAVIRRYFDDRGFWRAAPAPWKPPDRELEDREFWDVLDGCVGKLPRTLASAFILRELEDLGPAELCDVLEVSAANLRVRLHRARLLLRECLEKHWFGGEPGGTSRGGP
jgi:RNA polymerase sigma-70 factor, ECF subfamily